GKNHRHVSLQLRQLQFPHSTVPQPFSSRQKLIKTAQRGELQSHIGACLRALHEREEVIAKIVGRAFFPRCFVRRTESSQRLAIRLERARRSVSFVREVP